MNEDILKRIKQLPPLPESAIKIEAVYQDPDSSFNDMVKILEKDPLLTADILKAANSPLYGFSREINAISQAVGLFGMGTVRGFALASIVKKSFTLDLSPYGITNDLFSSLSKKQHALVTSWCLRKENRLLGILSPSAFLVEIGKALIAQEIVVDAKQEVFRNAIETYGSVEMAEKEIMNVTTPEVSSTIFKQWKFESKLVEVIKCCLNPDEAQSDETKRASAILKAVRVAIPLNGVVTDESISLAKEVIEKYDLNLEAFENAIALIKE